MHAGQVLLALAVLLPLALLLARAVRKVPRGGKGGSSRPGGGPLSRWTAHRRALRLEQVRHYNWMLRLKAASERRMAEQAARDERRRTGAVRGGTVAGEATWTDVPGGAAPAGGRPAGRRNPLRPRNIRLRPGPRWNPLRPLVIRLRPGPGQGAADPGPGGAGQRPPAGGETPPAAPGDPEFRDAGPAASQSPEPPSRGGQERPSSAQVPSRPATGQSAAPTVQGVIVTTPAVAPEAVPGVEMIIEGLHRIYAHAMAGNIQAKRRAVLALAEIGRRAAMTAFTLARAMAEPGQHYGTAVTERLGRMAALFSGAATAGAEADAELHAILVTTPGEAMAAGPMPHHEQFSETGAR